MIKKLPEDFIKYDYIGKEEVREIDLYATLIVLKDKINEIIEEQKGSSNK